MPAQDIILQPGTLWRKVVERSRHALQSGALQTIPTTYEWIEQQGVAFVVRRLVKDGHKAEIKETSAKLSASSDPSFNPFLPYEEDLFVTNLSPTHLCLLNKFNAVDHHLLMITRAFEEQEMLLNLQDFVAAWVCLAEMNGLVFYNGGQKAGASQRHKHLQMVPLPLMPTELSVPIEPLLASAQFDNTIGVIPSLPFRHAIAQLAFQPADSPEKRAEITLERYDSLLATVHLTRTADQQAGAYNLLMTREWMLLVPRSQEQFASIAVNALGFAGALLVRNEAQMQYVKRHGPLAVLQGVALPWTDPYSE